VFDERLGHIAFDYDSVQGPIHSDWTMKGATAAWHVTIPANTTAWLPLNAADAPKYKLDGTALPGNARAKAATREGQNGFELAPGSYTFEVKQ